MSMIEHGGGLDRMVERYGGPRNSWLDLSTGINPTAFDVPALPVKLWNRLPVRSLHDDALAAARGFYGVPDASGIVAAPGTQSLIQLLPELLPAGSVAVVSPTYAEHAQSFIRAGRRVVEISALSDIPDDCAVAVVVNPNNPDGRIHSASVLAAAHEKLAARGGWLIVDEVFPDAGVCEGVVPETPKNGLIVLKSFGKFFGLAGVRLGFSISNIALAGRIENRLGPWPVSGPALEIARRAFAGFEAVAMLRNGLRESSELLEGVLRTSGLEIAGRTRFFVLISDPKASELHEGLSRLRIYVRKFDYAANWLRFGLPASDEQRLRLSVALGELVPEPVT